MYTCLGNSGLALQSVVRVAQWPPERGDRKGEAGDCQKTWGRTAEGASAYQDLLYSRGGGSINVSGAESRVVADALFRGASRASNL